MVCNSCEVRAAVAEGRCLACTVALHVADARVPPCDALLPTQAIGSGAETDRLLLDTALHVHGELRLRHLVRYIAHKECLAALTGEPYHWATDSKLPDQAKNWLATRVGRSLSATNEGK